MRFEDTPHDRPSTAEEEVLLVEVLSEFMVAKLEENRGKRHWLDPDIPEGYLLDRLLMEVVELSEALRSGSADEAWREAADVAIFACFIADRYDDLIEGGEPS